MMAMSPGEMMLQDQMQAPAAPQMGNEMNPVLDAFRTMAEFVAAKGQMGDPNAPQMQSLLSEFVGLLSNNQGPASGEQSMMAPPPPEGKHVSAMNGQVPMMGRGIDPMVGVSPGAKAYTGQIPII
jgi:hypothetical protein